MPKYKHPGQGTQNKRRRRVIANFAAPNGARVNFNGQAPRQPPEVFVKPRMQGVSGYGCYYCQRPY